MIRGDYTHIVVGAGTAGCILAARLSESPSNHVVLIEAGGSGRRDPMLKVPIMTGMLLKGRRHVWRYASGPEPGLGGRRVDLPRGKVMGGSSSVNGMVYVRGLPLDYDYWAQSGMPEWSWDHVKPYFLKSEGFQGPGDAANHGTDGPLGVSRRETPVSPLANAFVDAGVAAGYPRAHDFNDDDPDGFGFYHFTNRNGYRETTATAFIDPVRKRKNLTVLTDFEVARVVFRNGTACGVELVLGRQTRTVETDGEIILCCGAIGSPALLMRSGVGPADHLRELGIDVVCDSPQVGSSLQDHVLVRVTHQTREDVSLYRLTRFDRAAPAFLQAWLLGRGPMNVFPLEAGAYYRTDGSDIPNVQSHFMPAFGSDTIRLNPFSKPAAGIGPGFMANASVMRPHSRGRLRLRGPGVKDDLDIRVNYLTDPRDAEVLADAVGVLRDVFSQKAFNEFRGAEVSPGPDVTQRGQLLDWVRETANTVHHLCGTCRMGPNETDVLDPVLRVRGVDNLRVADASVFPSIPSTNTAAPAMMIGERAAAFLTT
ncbi:MAG: GMC family oxidoreductase N-terminal domain-containing protein [Roseibium sp.]|nr:GMC family oxidoreductase N-terminal domain-containing protein [Roseibium sp.]